MIVISNIFWFMSIIFVIVSLMNLDFKIEKLGIPIFLNDVKWTWFVYRNKERSEIIDNYLLIDGYVIVFHYPWLWCVYEGNSYEEIRNKFSLGGQSNKSSYLTWWQKIIGKKIENWYIENVM